MFATHSLASLFLAYVFLVFAIVAAILGRHLSGRPAALAYFVLVAWLGYAGTLGYLGIVSQNDAEVPGIFILLAPVVVFVAAVLVRSRAGLYVATKVPVTLLIGMQLFRVGVELTLHQLWELGSVPRLLTLAGGNVDMLVGLSAPMAAWLASRGAAGGRAALIWNVIGLASLANVATRAVLTAPGPLNFVHGDVLNTALGTFPYTFIPGFMAPLAVMLHVLSIRALRQRGREYQQTSS
jgi:hypothetical protein